MAQINMQFDEGKAYLADKGLNLVGALAVDALPESIRQPLLQLGVDLAAYARLVVIGHAGRRLWEVLADERQGTPDPVDTFSIRHTTCFAETYLQDEAWQLLYPADIFFPLNELGELAGWGKASPLFLGIHPEYGLWWAYRTVFLTSLALPVSAPAAQAHPCDSCLSKPCISACPASALSVAEAFNVYACADYRAQSESYCGRQCIARQACPVGKAHQYTREQINYHYSLSLATIKAYKAADAGNG